MLRSFLPLGIRFYTFTFNEHELRDRRSTGGTAARPMARHPGLLLFRSRCFRGPWCGADSSLSGGIADQKTWRPATITSEERNSPRGRSAVLLPFRDLGRGRRCCRTKPCGKIAGHNLRAPASLGALAPLTGTVRLTPFQNFYFGLSAATPTLAIGLALISAFSCSQNFDSPDKRAESNQPTSGAAGQPVAVDWLARTTCTFPWLGAGKTGRGNGAHTSTLALVDADRRPGGNGGGVDRS